jgi:hypothetical protein
MGGGVGLEGRYCLEAALHQNLPCMLTFGVTGDCALKANPDDLQRETHSGDALSFGRWHHAIW